MSGLCAAVLSLAGVYLYLNPQIPKAETYRHVRLETPLRVYTADEQLIAEFGERRLIPVALADVPEPFIRALLDTEDKRFYEHSGVDFLTLATAAMELVWNMGEITRGGSTITMQLPRNLGTFSLDQLFIRKFKEILLALQMERELSKDEILELYINAVPFGKRAYGAQAAAFTYYGKPLSDLNLAQWAMLAGIPQAPSAGNPINGPERALNRRNLVLRRMLEQGSIDQAQYDEARAAPITASVHGRDLDVPAAFPAEWVRRQLVNRYDDLYTGGYEVVTTLRGNLQTAADAALRKGLSDYSRRHGYRGPEDQLLIDDDNPLDEDRARRTLTGIQSYGGLAPAVVLDVSETEATVVAGGWPEPIRLDLDAVRWARTFIDPDTRGPAITRVNDVLSVGDVIRVDYLGKVVPTTDTDAPPEAEDQEAPVAVDRWRLAQLPEIQGALVSLDPRTGAVLALSGGFDFGMNQYNHALQAARQPGSGFKPFVYSAALDAGVTPASIFMDAPLVFDDENLESEYRPDNDNNRYNGPTRLREALYRSINLVSMRVLLDVGAGQILNFAPRFGFDTRTFPRNTQLAIGGGTMEVTPVDMAAAYSVFANGGWTVEPHIISYLRDLEGEEIFRARHPIVCAECEQEEGGMEIVDDTDLTTGEPANLEELFAEAEAPGKSETDADAAEPEVLPPLIASRAIDERNAWIMHSMLRDVVARGTGIRARRALNRSDIAGKTGTTNDAADTWFNGYHPTVATTVWVGFPNHQALGANEYGSNRPLPIWIDYMTEALKGVPETFPDQPPGIVTRKIDPSSGELASPRNSEAIFEYFLAEHLPDAAPVTVDDEREDELKAVDIF
ncbi:MAG: PBP1A family penicillin-binding protein [Pseudomonadota bacterium]